MKYYISGPITGNAEYRKQFDEAEEALRAAGFNDLVNPARLEDVGRLDPESDYEAIMAIDMILLSRSGGLVQLVGWEGSRGANREYGYAIARGMEIIDIREVTPAKGGVREEKPEQASKEAMDAQKKAGRKRERVNHEVVHELRLEGHSWQAICEKLGKKDNYATALRKHHLELYPEDAEVTITKPIDTGKIRALRRARWSIPKIADEMGMSEEQIEKVLKSEEKPQKSS